MSTFPTFEKTPHFSCDYKCCKQNEHKTLNKTIATIGVTSNHKKTPHFICEACDFKCCKQNEYNRHLETIKHRSRNLAKKYAEVGILRRRVSKCEEFNTEFAECFDTPTELRGIIKLMSAQVEECDKTVSYIAGHNSVSNLDNTLYMNDFPLDYPTFCDGYETSKNDILPWDSIDGYFSNYADIDIESGNVEEKREVKEEETDKNNIVELTITSLRVDSNDGDDDYDYVEI